MSINPRLSSVRGNNLSTELQSWDGVDNILLGSLLLFVEDLQVHYWPIL